MIGELNFRYCKGKYSQLLAVQYEIKLPVRGVAWVGWPAVGVGAFQTCCRQKQFKFITAPEGIEITGEDHRLVHLFEELMEPVQLVLPMPVFQRQMDNEK